RFICIYPAFINSKKTIAEGRRIPIDKAVENPTYGKDIMLYVAETIPKLKTRTQKTGGGDQNAQQGEGGKKGKKKKK
ncbi:UNVERIFIED_CONTAM: hypothetical protein FKN15_010713, partial [Acipenser sinensis]